jgi:hypothetical protein
MKRVSDSDAARIRPRSTPSTTRSASSRASIESIGGVPTRIRSIPPAGS